METCIDPSALKAHGSITPSHDFGSTPRAQPELIAADTEIRQANGTEATEKQGGAQPKENDVGVRRIVPSFMEEARDASDEIVVNAGNNSAMTPSSQGTPAIIDEDETMGGIEDDDEPLVSHYPKRKRTSVFPDLSEDKLENTKAGRDDTPLTPDVVEVESKPTPKAVSNAKSVLLGFWRDSRVPEQRNKHAVIGFIDVRDRLRTRIQAVDRDGGRIASKYALGPGPGNCWVTFDRVAFSDHLIGLDSYTIKEYVRVRAGQEESTDDDRIENETTAVDIAWERAKAYYQIEDRADLPVKASQIAYGAIAPEALQGASRSETKRRKTSGFYSVNVNQAGAAAPAADESLLSDKSASSLDPLWGTRPTSIPIGHWKESRKGNVLCAPQDAHAVYGILGQNDMFRVKLLRQTREGRYFEGNFPSGAGALWIPYEDVVLDDLIADLSRNEVKEFCRIRQHQMDSGESPEQVPDNQQRAVSEARTRAAIMYATKPVAPVRPLARRDVEAADRQPSTPIVPELRQSGRAGLRRESRTARHAHEHDVGRTPRSHLYGEEAIDCSVTLAQQELAKAETSQARSSRHALNRERAAAAAAEEAANAAIAAETALASASGISVPSTATPSEATGRPRFSMSESAQRLNNVWASQEATRVRASGDDKVKIYDGVKFERKEMGPFIGKLTSPGSLITIDGEDFVEYRVLTRPSFY
ncbi:tRNA splicing endonuclease subunit [Sarocladium implicatum]|nr:tRNA splicing endonuclease subunit [Sarocladium implicatum]